MAVTSYHQLGSLKQKKSVLFQFKRVGIPNQGVGRSTPPPKALGGNPSVLPPKLLVAPAVLVL